MVCAELVIQWQGSAAPERSRYTAVRGYPHVPRESRTGLFSLIILYKNKYNRRKAGLNMIYLVYNMKSGKNKMIT
jgi:hypothetical protein